MIEFERYFKVLEREEGGVTIKYYNKKMQMMGHDVIGTANVDFELDAIRSLGIKEVK